LIQILYIDYNIVKIVVTLRKKYKIKLPDAIISATCLVKNAKLITNDLRLNKINEIKIIRISK